jgi:hypothetical protein
MWTKRGSIKKPPPAVVEEPLSDWMLNLSEEKKNVPISHLAIPGTHDSFTYSLNKGSPVGPGEFKKSYHIKKLKKKFDLKISDVGF